MLIMCRTLQYSAWTSNLRATFVSVPFETSSNAPGSWDFPLLDCACGRSFSRSQLGHLSRPAVFDGRRSGLCPCNGPLTPLPPPPPPSQLIIAGHIFVGPSAGRPCERRLFSPSLGTEGRGRRGRRRRRRSLVTTCRHRRRRRRRWRLHPMDPLPHDTTRHGTARHGTVRLTRVDVARTVRGDIARSSLSDRTRCRATQHDRRMTPTTLSGETPRHNKALTTRCDTRVR